MGLVEDIQAVRDREDLTLLQKRQAIYDLKGQAIEDALASRVRQPIVRGIWVLTFTKQPRYKGNCIVFPGMTLTRNGVNVPLDLPLRIVNPPILVPDGLGGFTLNLLQAVRDAIMDMVR